MMRRAIIAAFLATCHYGVICAAPSPTTSQKLDLLMPGVRPQKPDTYLCQAFKVDDAHSYITGFDPKADATIAHHILLYGCDTPGIEPGNIWNCGEMSSSGSSGYPEAPVCSAGAKIVYAWAMEAPKLNLPPDVSFDVGQDTDVKYLVLQVHYKNVTKFLPPQNGKDNSGLSLETTSTPTTKQAGVYLLSTGGHIPPHTVEYFEAACPFEEDKEIVPFAYRTHAHSLGRVISGYRIRDGEWTEIGRKDPRLPEMFYNVTTDNLTVRKGDILAARCTMENGLDHQVSIGATQKDEMCNFYVMYYVNTPPILSNNNCQTMGPPIWYWSDYSDQAKLNINNVPNTASVIPGTDTPMVRNATKQGVDINSEELGERDIWQQAVQEIDPEEINYIVQQLEADQEEQQGVGVWPQYFNVRQQQDLDPYAYYNN